MTSKDERRLRIYVVQWYHPGLGGWVPWSGHSTRSGAEAVKREKFPRGWANARIIPYMPEFEGTDVPPEKLKL